MSNIFEQLVGSTEMRKHYSLISNNTELAKTTVASLEALLLHTSQEYHTLAAKVSSGEITSETHTIQAAYIAGQIEAIRYSIKLLTPKKTIESD